MTRAEAEEKSRRESLERRMNLNLKEVTERSKLSGLMLMVLWGFAFALGITVALAVCVKEHDAGAGTEMEMEMEMERNPYPPVDGARIG